MRTSSKSEQVFKEVPWSSDALLDCNQEVELIQLVGSEEYKAKLCALILKYRKVFSLTLREKPAEVPPMSLDVDIEKWQVLANQRAPRLLQTSKMQDELRRHIKNMLDQHIIQPSSSALAYSHVLLVP